MIQRKALLAQIEKEEVEGRKDGLTPGSWQLAAGSWQAQVADIQLGDPKGHGVTGSVAKKLKNPDRRDGQRLHGRSGRRSRLAGDPRPRVAQLKGAYSLSVFSALWRTALLLIFCNIVVALFVTAIICLGLGH